MTVLAYSSSGDAVVGQRLGRISDLPKNQNGFQYYLKDNVSEDITSVGGDPNNLYFVSWNVEFVFPSVSANAPILQAPVQKTYRGILAITDAGSIVAERYICYEIQKTDNFGFWLELGELEYPTTLPFDPQGEVEAIIGTSVPYRNGDGFIFLPQYSSNDADFLVSYLATISAVPAGTVVTPLQFSFVS